jgi:hypothetical protein
LPAAAEGFDGEIAIDTSVAEVTVSVAPLLVTPDSVAVIVAVPADAPVASPLALIDADEDDDCHETCAVRFCVEPSVKLPVAVNCCVVPAAIDEVCGVTLIELSAAEVIVTVIDCVTLPDAAVTVALPEPTPVATPLLDTDTTPLADEVQLIELVKSCVDPSLYVPVACNCTDVPSAIDGFDGVIVTDTSVAGVIVIDVEADVVPYVPVTVAEPVVLPFARPVESIVTALDELDHEAWLVKFCCEPSEKYPVIVNCCDVPAAIEGSVGEIASDVSFAGEMLTLVVELTPPNVAVIVPEPAASPVASPFASISTAGPELDHVTDEVMSCVVPSL